MNLTWQTEPIDLAAALERELARQLLPTDLRTRLLREIPAQLRRQATYSAGVTQAEILEAIRRTTDEILAGETSASEARLSLLDVLERIGYQPDEGTEGTLLDLSSYERGRTIVDTNVQVAQSWAYDEQGQDPDVLDEWPAYELVRVGTPTEPRDWTARWRAVGGQLREGRMVALKSDSIWQALGSEFDDGLGNPFPPFAWGSTMDWIEVDRDEAERLGLLEAGEAVQPRARRVPLGGGSSTAVAPNSPLGRALVDSLDGLAEYDQQGVLRFRRAG